MLLRVFILLVSFVWTSSSLLSLETSKFNGVSVDKKSGDIQFNFSSKLNLKRAPKLSYFDTYFEFNLNDSFIDQAKFFDVDNEYIQKIGVYPTSESSLGVRLFTDQEGSLERYQLSSLSLAGNSINFNFDKSGYLKLKEATSKDNKDKDTNKDKNNEEVATSISSEKTDLVLASTQKQGQESQISNSTKDSKTVLGSSALKLLYDKSQKSVKDTTLQLKNSSLIKSNLVSILMFLSIMVLGCIALYFSRNIFSKKFGKKTDANIKIKTLAVSSLSPKQKVTLVEVCGERILLGVTPSSVSFITKLATDNSLTLSSYNPALESRSYQPGLLGSQNTTNNTNNLGLNENYKIKKVQNPSSSFGAKVFSSKKSTRTESFSDDSSNYDQETGDILQSGTKTNSSSSLRTVSGGTSVDLKKEDSMNSSNDNSTSSKSIDNVTRLIREKLKNLPSMN